MADYNIYIHSMDGQTNGSQSGGGGSVFTKPWGSGGDSGEEAKESNKLAKQTPNFMADAKETMTVAKINPWVAVAYAVVKVAFTITKTAGEFHAIQTGDFRVSHSCSNLESMKNALFHPVSTTIQTLKTIELNRIENQRREMQRELLGDSEINAYTNRGF